MKLNEKKFDLIMAQKCMTAKELSAKTGVTESTIAKAKNGNRTPRPSTIGKLAAGLGVSVESIIEAI
ncbi:MAG: helix-turn-helix domain-containing protein [Clostridiales bacterium]|nr:helix-turn-helix domain-containing protein [Clostridiales bacterium]